MRRIILFLCGGGLALAAPDVRRPIFVLSLVDGRTLTNVTIVSYAYSAVMARWDGGRGTLPYEAFPEDWRKALEVFRPPPPSVTVRLPAPPPPPAAAEGGAAEEGKGEGAAEGASPEAPAETKKSLESLAAELDELRARLDKIEKRLRIN